MLDEKKQITDLLSFDHSELDELLAELFAAFETENVRQIYDSLDIFWARLAMHIRAEHLHLFPAILNNFELNEPLPKTGVPTFEKVKNTIERLQDDHNFFMRELLGAIKQMRELRENDQTAAEEKLWKMREKIIVVKNRLETHNELEETQIYSWADSLFQTADKITLNEKMAKELANLPPRFI